MRLRGKALADALIAAFTTPPQVRAEFRKLFDQLYATWHALPRDERAHAEWVMSDDELRRIDKLGREAYLSWHLDIFNPMIFGKPVRLDPSAEDIQLIPSSRVAA